MARSQFHELEVRREGGLRWKRRIWRERCFLQTLWRHFALRALIMMVILVGCATLLKALGSEPDIRFDKAMWHSWMLIFGEPPGDYPDSIVLDVLYFLMPILGLTVIIEGIIDFALTIRDRKRYERSWCEMMASSMKDHIIIVGFGRLGFSSYQLLRRLGENVIVIERDELNQFLEVLRRDGVPLILGDARREALLEDANISRAKAVIVATDDDLANLEIALDAQRLKPEVRVVLRMFDQNMADKVGAGFRINLAMSQSAVSAPAFAMPAVDASIVHSFVVGDQLIVMQEWSCRAAGPLCGSTVGEMMRNRGVSVVRLRRSGERDAIFPSPDLKIQDGDELLVQGRYDVLKSLREYASVE